PSPAPSPLSLHDALPICRVVGLEVLRDPQLVQPPVLVKLRGELVPCETGLRRAGDVEAALGDVVDDVGDVGLEVLGDELLAALRSEEHTSELQSPCNLVC